MPSLSEILVSAHSEESSIALGNSVFSNYADTYEQWDEEETERCPDCHGTGLDRDEVYECETCYGEGVIVLFRPGA